MTPPRLRPRNRAEWLLAIPIVVPLLIPLYNRVDPVLLGVPFFYWFQIACAGLAVVVITLVHRLGRGRH
ncbi:DUF3311 domain-containing protein [Hamadaea sp. NPDC050747]|uniref:DUF3311 domain-containing protein n=1 Tax=Hamadaea sp. NPDC050747 TaxID=3155789 RepID=UPI0033D81315